MKTLHNPYRGVGLPHDQLHAVPFPLDDPAPVLAMLKRCPAHDVTPLRQSPGLARQAGISAVSIKDERGRMGLGSFKALGAAHVIARDAASGCARGQTYVTASAGNHGLSVAAGAAAFGAHARVYLSDTVPEGFAVRLSAQGAEVVRAGSTYEDSMAAAAQAAQAEGLALLSDSSWPGYTDRPHVLMEGYLALMAEAVAQIEAAPTHIFLQAGVGGLAGAAAAHARQAWGDGPRIVVVEPDAAPALFASVAAGAPTETPGPVSCMGRLDCKAPSLIALKGLARDADDFVLLTEAEAIAGTAQAVELGFASTPSGAAGVSALLAAQGGLGLGPASHALCILTEVAE